MLGHNTYFFFINTVYKEQFNGLLEKYVSDRKNNMQGFREIANEISLQLEKFDIRKLNFNGEIISVTKNEFDGLLNDYFWYVVKNEMHIRFG